MRAVLPASFLAGLLVVSVLLARPALADETGRPAGDNCNVASAPDSAGETLDHGNLLKVYPRARDIGPAYSGCQGRWAQTKTGWRLAGLAVITKGEARRFWTPEVAVVTCIYDKGAVVLGDAKTCPAQSDLILKSRASGCVEKIRRTVEQGGNPSPHLPGCEPE